MNVGVSSWSFTVFSEISLTFIPISGSYLIGGKNSYLELNAGLSPVFASADSGTIDLDGADGIPLEGSCASALFGFAGAGYRYWPWDGGFHFRLTADLPVGSGGAQPWGGLTLGYAF